MEQPIVFLFPPEIEGQTGYQVVDDELHIVTDVLLEDHTPAPQPCSYRGA